MEDYNSMVIDQAFMNEFLRLAREINGSIRLTAATSIFHRESSLLRLYNALEAARVSGANTEFAPGIKALVAAVPQDRQRRYSTVIKYVEKRMTNQGTHIFASLKAPMGNGPPLSEKLSKSQQRFTNPLLAAETGHGLCAQMALLWLKEQLDSPLFGTSFPRLATGNVVGSKTAYALTSTAADLKRSAITHTPQARIEEQMLALGLRYIRSGGVVNFERFQEYYQNHPEMNGFYIEFNNAQHAIAMFRKNVHSCHFYDGNAGSYSIMPANITLFLREYNNICLPRKWVGYAAPTTQPFSCMYSVSI